MEDVKTKLAISIGIDKNGTFARRRAYLQQQSS
jgi:hypothetical protein